MITEQEAAFMKKSEMAILSVLVLAAVFVFNGKINRVTNPCG